MCFRCKLVTIGHLWVIEEIYFGEICQHLPGQPPCVDIKPGIDPTFQINMLATGALSSSVYLDFYYLHFLHPEWKTFYCFQINQSMK